MRSVSEVLDSIVVSISGCHPEDPGSIPGRGVLFFFFFFFLSLLSFPSLFFFPPAF